MSANLGLEWGEEQPSSSRMNAKSLFYGTGDDIATITISSPIALVFCTEDGSGFLANNMYQRHFDDVTGEWSGWDNVFRPHNHSDDTTEGGDYYDIQISNAATRLEVYRPYLTEEMFYEDSNGSTTFALVVADDSQYLRMATGTSANNWHSLQTGGVKASVSSSMEWHTKFEIDGETGILWRMGVGMEKVGENSESTLQKFGIEGCDGDGVSIQLVSCNGGGGGADRVKTNTTVGMDQGVAIGVKISYIPSTSVIYEDTLSTVKSSPGGFPSSGAIDSDKMLRYGIKTTNTTEKLMYIWADALYGKINDPSWI